MKDPVNENFEEALRMVEVANRRNRRMVVIWTAVTILAAFAMIIMLVGCSGGGSGDTPAAPPATGFANASQLATAAGCPSYTPGESQMYTQETGDCQIGGQDLYIMTFADPAARDSWFQAAKAVGAPGFFGHGDRWVLQGDDQGMVENATRAAGGTVGE